MASGASPLHRRAAEARTGRHDYDAREFLSVRRVNADASADANTLRAVLPGENGLR